MRSFVILCAFFCIFSISSNEQACALPALTNAQQPCNHHEAEPDFGYFADTEQHFPLDILNHTWHTLVKNHSTTVMRFKTN